MVFESAAFAFLALTAVSQWVPMRWHSTDPTSLELLAGTPVNCILLESNAWKPAFLSEAARRHFAVAGVIHPGPDAARQSTRALALKLAALVLDGDFDPSLASRLRSSAATSSTLLIQLAPRRGLPLLSRDPILGTSQALWPGIEIEHGGKVMTGPTSTPWIDTNTGFLRFVRAAHDATVWVGVIPPAHQVLSADRYAQAIGDAALAGARWIVALDADLENRLLARQPTAVATWRGIARYLAYFENHPEWRGFRPASRLGVVEDTASGALLSAGLLDMLASLRVEARAIPTRRLSADQLQGVHLLLNIDAASLDAPQRQLLSGFALSGGVVLNPPADWRFPAAGPDRIVPNRQQANAIQSIWESIYNLTVRKNFCARTFNTSGVLSSVLESPGGSSVLVHLLNYTDFPDEQITVHVLGHWKRARLYRPGKKTLELPVYTVPDGTGVDIDKLTLLATLRMD
ncbi:MAG: hypothetical protein ABI165_16305 [Bryobacteraceae bacterium]